MVNIWIVAAALIWYLVLNSFRSVWIYSVGAFYVLWYEWAACTIDDQRLIAVDDTRKISMKTYRQSVVVIMSLLYWINMSDMILKCSDKLSGNGLTNSIWFHSEMNRRISSGCNSCNYNESTYVCYMWPLVWFGFAFENRFPKCTFVFNYKSIDILPLWHTITINVTMAVRVLLNGKFHAHWCMLRFQINRPKMAMDAPPASL